jgi:hypothetical protein
MYTTDKYVFLHMNKCAGVFIKDFMIEYFNATVHKYKHGPIRMLAPKHRGKIKIGCVRNIFDWYVSYYTYHQDNGYFLNISFDKYIRDYTMSPRALLSLMPKKYRKKFPLLYPPKTSLPIGAYTFHYINYFCNDAINVFEHWDYDYFKLNINKISNLDVTFRTETLKDNMEITFGAEYHDDILSFKKRNVSKRKRYQDYFTPDLRALVEARDGALMEYLGYEWTE